ncbi:MAG: DUF4840 domain-containing protein [Muribaculaceae bacterium]|nr:DUF4840 domain-containing protein [Muribaculaceae bacterium]
MKQIIFFLFITLIFISSCNKEEPRFTSSQIQNALFEMKGIYYGDMRVSYYHGDRISEGNVCKVMSTDSLTIHMDLEPMASTIADEAVASRLKEIGAVVVKAGYDFLQMDDTMFSFVLLPDEVVVSGDHGGQSPVRIVFDQTFGGDTFYYGHHSIMFNLSPIELWIGEEKYESFRQLVYHYEGSMDNYTL